MQTTTVLRALIVAEVVLEIAATLAPYFTAELPPAVYKYLEGPGAGPLPVFGDGEITALMYVYLGVGIALIVLYLASLVGLFLLKRWARPLYVISFVVSASTFLLLGSSLVGPIDGAIDYLTAVCSGAILAILYLSDLKAVFDASPVKSPEPMRAA